jgi:hypothetical protein
LARALSWAETPEALARRAVTATARISAVWFVRKVDGERKADVWSGRERDTRTRNERSQVTGAGNGQDERLKADPPSKETAEKSSVQERQAHFIRKQRVQRLY